MCAILMEETTGAKLKTKSLEVFIDGQKKETVLEAHYFLWYYLTFSE